MNRREILKLGAASLIASQIPWPLKRFGNAAFASTMNLDFGAAPLAPIIGTFQTSKFDGDNEAMPHDILWNKPGFIAKLGGIPKPSISCDLVVIGGGMAGLLAAYRSPRKDVIVLEQDPRFGGNSKGEVRANGSAFSQGAAYICNPKSGDSSDQLLKELNLKGRVEEGAPFLLGEILRANLWDESAISEKARADLQRLEDKLKDIYENDFPEIPLGADAATSQKTLALDALTFEAWLNSEFGSLDPLVLEYLQIYCWSSFNASISELSAAQALNFIAGEVGGVLALPGGNAAIANGLYQALVAKRGAESLHASSFVVDVKVLGDRVEVCTFENGKLVTIKAEYALFAAPKFLAKTLIEEMPQPLLKAFTAISYRAYLVANVELNAQLTAPHFDVFSLQGRVPESPSALKPIPRPFTDIVFADWAQGNSAVPSVLTVYRPLPVDGARQFLFAESAFEKHKGLIREGLTPFLKSIGLGQEAVSGMRMSRWGHAVPVALKGFIANGTPSVIESAYGSRLQFIGQDVWANPSFETAVATTERALAKI